MDEAKADEQIIHVDLMFRCGNVRVSATDKRKKPEAEKRKPINCLVHPDTLRLLKPLAAHLKLSQGQVLDRAVAALAVAESFGAQHLKLNDDERRNSMPEYDPIVYGDGSGLTLRRSEIVSSDKSKSGALRIVARRSGGGE